MKKIQYAVKELSSHHGVFGRIAKVAIVGVPASLVCMDAILVRIEQDDPSSGWTADGMNVDYMSSGKTKKDCIDHFVNGFVLTVAARVKHHGLDKNLPREKQ